MQMLVHTVWSCIMLFSPPINSIQKTFIVVIYEFVCQLQNLNASKLSLLVCVCVCVSVRERERERNGDRGYEEVKQGSGGAREIDPDMTCI